MASLLQVAERTTLDVAQERFRNEPSDHNAAVYAIVVSQYFDDEVVGAATYRAALLEIAASMK